jgi:hypothetical protein
MKSSIICSLEELVANYVNTAEHNDALYRQMTALTWSDPQLSEHRRYVEENKLGFGDPAFHSMWLRIMIAAERRFGSLRMLEIGVFKGQIISLWKMISEEYCIDLRISAITPLKGQPKHRFEFINRLRSWVNRGFREKIVNGNFYENDDYERIIRDLFLRFDLSFDSVNLHRGFSTDRRVIEEVGRETFHVVYVDGDHTLAGALHDFKVYGSRVLVGGFLIADDAGCSVPGTTFWKGHKSVATAAETLPSLGFRNILNVGHNRIYERVSTNGPSHGVHNPQEIKQTLRVWM